MKLTLELTKIKNSCKSSRITINIGTANLKCNKNMFWNLFKNTQLYFAVTGLDNIEIFQASTDKWRSTGWPQVVETDTKWKPLRSKKVSLSMSYSGLPSKFWHYSKSICKEEKYWKWSNTTIAKISDNLCHKHDLFFY